MQENRKKKLEPKIKEPKIKETKIKETKIKETNKENTNKEKTNKRRQGTEFEEKAMAYLEKNGLCILEHSYRCRTGEIDIVARDQDYYVFVEVKYRSSDRAGYAEEAVDYKKQKVICKTAEVYLLHKGLGEFTPVRFDVVAFNGEELHWIKNAFDFKY